MAATDPSGDAPAPPSPRGGRNLPIAIAVGAGLAAAYIGSVLLNPLLFLGFIVINLTVGLYELDAAFARTKEHPPTIVAAIALPFMCFGAYYLGTDGPILVLIAALIVGFVYTMLTSERGHAVSRMAALSLMLLWVNLLASSLGLLLARDEGYWFVLAATALTVTNDIGAYAFGRNFGRTRMAPSISPRKSWEGFAGAMLTTIAMAVLVTARVVPGVTIPIAIVLAIAIVIAATLGDLSESVLKRDLGVKDLGSIFPGHGGVMDRVDALLFSLPTAHLVLKAFGV